MKIGEVSKELGIPSATLRYYEQIGLLEDIKKEHGIREYQEEDIERLNFIICMKKAGFKLEDIIKFLELIHDKKNRGRKKIRDAIKSKRNTITRDERKRRNSKFPKL